MKEIKKKPYSIVDKNWLQKKKSPSLRILEKGQNEIIFNFGENLLLIMVDFLIMSQERNLWIINKKRK